MLASNFDAENKLQKMEFEKMRDLMSEAENQRHR